MTAPQQAYFAPRPLAREYMVDERQHRTEIARTANLAMRGQSNNSFQVTLTPSATSTVITDPRISLQTAVHLSAITASAATALASGSLYVVAADGTATIHHPSNAATDQTFAVSLVG